MPSRPLQTEPFQERHGCGCGCSSPSRRTNRLLDYKAALVPVVVLLPDMAMMGYVSRTRIGAHLYNFAHAIPVPALIIGLGWWQNRPLVLGLGLVWIAHIALDRLTGYGLKYGDHFQHSHLGMLGRSGNVSKELVQS